MPRRRVRVPLAVALAAAPALLPGCFLTRAVGLGPDPDPRLAASDDPPEVLYAKGRTLFEAREWADAEDAFGKVWREAPRSAWAADARFYEAECRYAREKWNGAFEYYKAFLKEQPLSPHAPLVERRLYDMGVFRLEDGKHGFFDSSSEGVDVLEYLVSAFPNGNLADDALLRIADHEVEYRRPQDAVDHLHDLLDRYPGSEWAFEARLRLARAYRELNRGTAYDADSLKRSAAQYRAYLEIVGATPARAAEHAERIEAARKELRGVEETLGRKGLEESDFYLYDGRIDAARAALRNVIRTWPGTEAAAEARRRLGEGGGAAAAAEASPPPPPEQAVAVPDAAPAAEATSESPETAPAETATPAGVPAPADMPAPAPAPGTGAPRPVPVPPPPPPPEEAPPTGGV